MPVIGPFWTATLRSYWPLIGALLVLAVLSVSDLVWFRPVADRYQSGLKQAAELGLSVDPNAVPPVLPPRLFALLTDNSMPAVAAQEQGASGVLTARLMEDMTQFASRHGMHVISTEPGAVTQQPQSVQVRAHLRLRSRYEGLVDLLGEVADSGTLIALDRFTVVSDAAGAEIVDLWVSRYVIKQSKEGR